MKNKKNGILQHAVLYLKRKKSRTGILAGIFLILSILVLSGITLTGAVQESLLELRTQFYAFLSVERTADEEHLVTPQLTEDAVEAVEPKMWCGINTYYLSMKELSLIPGKFTAEGNEAAQTARMVACTESVMAREFTEGKLEMTQGRTIESGDTGTAVISEDLAKANGLKIGDIITGTVTDEVVMRARVGVGNTYDFEIVGMFMVDPEAEISIFDKAESEMLSNYIFVDEASGMRITEEVWQIEPQYTNGIILWVEDPALLEDNLEKVKSIPDYNWDSYFINTNNAEYDRSAEPLVQMERILFFMMGIVIVLGLVILVIILTMWNQERTREIGVFLSMGFSKGRIMSRLIVENLLVFAGSFIFAVPFVFAGVRVLAEILDISGAALRIGNVFGVGLCGVLFCVAVTALSSIKIMRVNPREILAMTS